MTEPPLTHEHALELAPWYVLGALERADEAAVRAHLETCRLSHAELEELGGVVPALLAAELDGLELVEPPAALRDRIRAAAAADLAGRPGADARPAPAAERTSPGGAITGPDGDTRASFADARAGADAGEARERDAAVGTAPIAFPSTAERTARAGRRRAGALDWALRVAAVLAIVVSGAYALGVQGQLDRGHAFDQAVAAVIEAGSQPDAKVVVLAAQKDQHGSGLGAVTRDGSLVLAFRDLAATSGTQSYATWVIVGSAPPLNVGEFAVDASGIRSFTTKPADTPEGALIAVTLEPRAGNAAPAGLVVVAGRAAAPPPENG